jgi:hypothetical protein
MGVEGGVRKQTYNEKYFYPWRRNNKRLEITTE